ncbi:helix-turn-helix domain-containing protein [Rossellomorea marisflavi]|uniref:helix-turn-helix domain-containing protein n=1 Tax=Rossellomorea marisflavi TaxID=189381 RepID=UPI001318E7A5|nr:helix-turn-helix transcriptional regulator [Rossellomorea marisflavi]QHA37730.1 helix-turn-helix domain-containing protein [Rossellomorea marisflavi]
MKLAEIGKKISELRREMNLTQGELAQGICTQALISLIEKGELDPNATILYQISKKLGVDVNYFFAISSTPRLDYITEVERQLRDLRILLRYEDMMEIVETEEKNPLFYQDPSKLQYLYWHKSIYSMEVEKDYEQATSLLEKAFTLVPKSKRAYTEQELEMLLTQGVFEETIENYEEAIFYYKKVESIVTETNRMLTDPTIKSRYFYNLARVYTHLGKLEESIDLLTSGIEWGVECGELYIMAEFHYQVSYNFELQNNYEKALEYLMYSIQLFELNPDYPYKEFLSEKKSTYLQIVKKLDYTGNQKNSNG